MKSSRDLTAGSAQRLLALGLESDEESLLTTAYRSPGDEQLTPGASVAGRFRITALAGRGGMGDVYRADDLKLGQPVALKFLPDSVAANSEIVRTFYDEVRVGRQVSHPNVCRIYDLVDVGGRPAIVMEFVEGEDLASLLRRASPLPYPTALRIARDVVAGVEAAHEKGVVHGDLKPPNVMIDGRGRARIMDFGLARIAGESREDGRVAGTLAYMPPEQLSGASAPSQSGDLFSLGLVLYEIFTGVRTREAPPTAHQPLLEPELERVILRCLEPDPKLRPASAREVREAFPSGDILDSLIEAGETPSSEMVAESRKVRELSTRQATIAAAAALGMLAAVVLLSQRLTLYGRTPLPLAPRELALLVRTIVQESNRDAVDEASWFEAGVDTRYGAPIVFHYRSSAAPLVPVAPDHRIHDSEPISPGMVHAVVRPDGRLVALRAFSSGAYVETSAPDRDAPAPATTPRVAYLVYFTILLLSLAAGAWLAHRNIRANVVDSRAAWRIALWVMVCRAGYGLVIANHPLTLDAELALLASIAGAALLLAAQVWLGYAALEPYVRRASPALMIGWARAVHGRLRDRIVARDVLLGTCAGLALRLVDQVRNAVPYGVTPSHLAVRALSSMRDTVANILLFQSRAIFYALFGLFVLVLLEVILKRRWLAGVVWLAVTTMAWIRWDDPVVAAPAVILQMAIVLAVLRRLGLLAGVATIFVHLLTVYTPLTADPRAFYLPQSLLAISVIGALAGLAFALTQRRGATA